MATERFTLIPAVYLVLRKGDQVLLHLRSANASYQNGKYSLIAGHLDGDELATHGLVRETLEEAGITIKPENLTLVHTAHRLSRGEPGQERIDLFFEATEWSGEITNVEPQKCDGLDWFSLHDLPDNMIPLVKQVLQQIDAGVRYSEYTKEPA